MAKTDPLQNFIQQFMSMNQFLEQQRQFNQQEVLQQRQLENQELQNFSQLASQVNDPKQLGSLTEFFASRNPDMADSFTSLRDNLVPAMETIRTNAAREGMAAMDPRMRGWMNEGAASASLTGQSLGANYEDQVTLGTPESELRTRASIAGGTALSAGQKQQGSQFSEQMAFNNKQFNEDVRQFGISTAIENQRTALQSRGLDLQAADIAQRGALGEMGFMTQAGLLPMTLRADQQNTIADLQSQLDDPDTPAGKRRGIATQISDTKASMNQLDQFISAEMSRGSGAGGLGANDLPSLLETRRKLIADFAGATNRAAQNDLIAQIAENARILQMVGGGQMPDFGAEATSGPHDAYLRRREFAPKLYDFMAGSDMARPK